MGIGKRAFLYVTRKKVRSILLFFIFFITGLFLLTGISIKQSAKEAADEFQKTLTTGLKVEQKIVDPLTVMDISLNENGETVIKYKVPFIMEEYIEEFLAIEGVSGFYCESMERDNAYTGLEVHPAFINGAVELVEGRHVAIHDVAKVVISDELEERNGLKIGDFPYQF